ncbi:hypothetical protein BU16DRAFT_496027 [Lophium mytilinum]|uniref:Uncharacterized protein n=1 Tax=Lophium mytilinum TaxID=390894 RepID=A0A6A6QB10_9PEZI|nr:hypothetical protein BU16DRAFT_496027 [Lophium mytilinum]
MAERVSSHNDLIHPRYSGETDPDSDRIVRIPAFKRNVYVPSHGASAADLANFLWLLKFGGPEHWYERPDLAKLDQMTALDAVGCAPNELKALDNPRPLSLPVPQIWVSSALNTPTDDDIFDCMAGHSSDGDFAGACHECTDEKCEAIEKTSLVYILVISTFQANEYYSAKDSFSGNGKNIYKMVRCGRREAAAAAAFYAAGVNGWSVVFSCVMVEGETELRGNGVTVERVTDLWRLADRQQSGKKAKMIFY